MPRVARFGRYGFAALWVGVAACLRLLLDPILGDYLPFGAFLLALPLVAWHVGSGPALAATILGFFLGTFLFVPPRFSLAIYRPEDVVDSLTFVAVGVAIAGLRFLSERTEQREAARSAELQASEERFRSLIVAGAQVLWTTGPDGVAAQESPSWNAFTGQTAAGWQGWGWLDAVHPDDRVRVARTWRGAAAEGTGFELEYRLRRADGEYVWMLARGAPVRNADGSIREWVGSHHDISDRRRAEETQRRLAAIVESADVAIASKTLDGIVTSWNRAAERIFGYTAEEMIGQRISRLLPPGREDELPAILHAIRQGRRVEPFETERIRKDGRRIHISLTVSPIFDASGQVVGASKIARDISEAKRAAEVLRRQEQQARRTAEYAQAVTRSMGEGLYMLDAQGLVTFVNPASERMFGWTGDELLGRRMHDVTHYAYPDGRPFPAEECPGLRVMAGASLIDHEDFFIRKDGSFFPVTFSASPVIEDDRVVGIVVVFRDRTETVRKELEREELFAAAQRARAEAEAANLAKDEFLSMISHELRTPLSSMLNWLRVLRSGARSHTARALESMQRSAEAQARLVDDLLDISRAATGQLRLEREPVDLAAAVRSSLEALMPSAHAKHLRIERKLESALVLADVQRLQQVTTNLLSNAVKFTSPGGLVQVAVERGFADARLVVRDDGAGIAPEFLPYVFERFRQAEPAASRRHGGLGLGLAIVRELVELHGGSVRAESEGEGRGTAFTVTLPLLGEGREEGEGGGGGAEQRRADRRG
jgi:PAS domain S-box-containing protein